MKKRIGAALFVLIFSLSVIAPAAASVVTTTLQVQYADIKIQVDGKQFTPRDVNGKVVEPFASDGTTYLPVRAVANALGVSVEWDGSTNTAILTSPEQGLDPATVAYAWDIVQYSEALDTLVDLASIAGAMQSISDYNDVVDSYNYWYGCLMGDLLDAIENDTMQALWTAANNQTEVLYNLLSVLQSYINSPSDYYYNLYWSYADDFTDAYYAVRDVADTVFYS